MRPSLQARPSGRPRPRQLNVEDWVPSSVQPAIDSQRSQRGISDSFTSGSSKLSSYIAEASSIIDCGSARSSFTSTRQPSVEESSRPWGSRARAELTTNTHESKASTLWINPATSPPASRDYDRQRRYSDRSDTDSLDFETKVRPLGSSATLPSRSRESIVDERYRTSDRLDNQHDIRVGLSRLPTATTKSASPLSSFHSGRQGSLEHPHERHDDTQCSNVHEGLKRRSRESQNRQSKQSAPGRYTTKDFRVDLNHPKRDDWTFIQPHSSLRDETNADNQSGRRTQSFVSSNQSDNDSPSRCDSHNYAQSVASHSPSLSANLSTLSVTRTPSEQRAELYAFRKDMREVFCSVDEMVDAHRDVFRSDPTTGIPMLNSSDLLHAEKLAEQVFKQLGNLRERYQLVAASFEKPLASPLSETTVDRRQSIGSDGNRASARSSTASDNETDYHAPQQTIDTCTASEVGSLGRTSPTFVGCSSLDAPDGTHSELPVSRRSSVSATSTSASIEAPTSPSTTVAESVNPSEMFPSRDSSNEHTIESPSFKRKRKGAAETGANNVFQGMCIC